MPPYIDHIRQPVFLDAPQLPADFWEDPGLKTEVQARQVGKGFTDLMGLQLS